MTKSKLRKKGFILFTCPGNSPSLRIVRTGIKAWQEPEGRNWCRALREVVLTGLLLTACLLCFPKNTRSISSVLSPPTMGWSIPYQSIINTLHACLLRHFLKWDSVLLDDLSLGQDYIKLASTMIISTAWVSKVLFLCKNACSPTSIPTQMAYLWSNQARCFWHIFSGWKN